MKTKAKIEFGDFQTPKTLADKMMEILLSKKISPQVIIEPTCGLGSILLSATDVFTFEKALGIELQNDYLENLKTRLPQNKNIELLNANIFDSFNIIKSSIENFENILFVGNPPWVTNTELSSLQSKNLPQKTNVDNLRGIEAITGKSNFDICESIILNLIKNFSNQKTVFAFLCKTIVARNILKRIWKNNVLYKDASIYPIDAKKDFNAAVDACFFILDFSEKNETKTCDFYDSIDTCIFQRKIGFLNNRIVNDVSNDIVLQVGGKSNYIWRNGVKHDCSKVMEFEENADGIFNELGEKICIENDLIFPLCKSSDLAKVKFSIRKKVLVTQKFINEDTNFIKNSYPKTWEYLMNHNSYFEKRKSVIYKNKPKFSIFSVGDYTFKPYKIAISGFYKKINFQLLTPFNEKTVVVDDTCNFISFDTKAEAEFIFGLLTSNFVTDYLAAVISWDSKRPITTDILNSIDLHKVSKKMSVEKEYENYCMKNTLTNSYDLQPTLFDCA